MVTRGGWHILRSQPRPHSKEAGPRDPQIFGTSYMHAHSMRNKDQILYGGETKCEEVSTWSTMNADTRSVCGR